MEPQKLVVGRCFSCSKGKKTSGSMLVFGGVGCLPHFPSWWLRNVMSFYGGNAVVPR